MLDFRIFTFLEVCKQMNFTKAAKKLNITQPAVSQHIRWLEKEYGIKLFEMEGKKLSLTEEGDLFRNAAMTFQHDEMYLKHKIQEIKKGKRRIYFGATLTIGDFILPRAAAEFIKMHPDTEVSIRIANTEDLLNQLDQGEIDFAMVEGYFEMKEYDYRIYSRESYIAVCGRDYCFQKEPEVLEDLLSEPLITREAGSGTREIMEKSLEGRNLKIGDFKKNHEASSLHMIKKLVAEGCGITFLYEAAAGEELRDGILRKLELKDFPVVHDFTFVWRNHSIFSQDYLDIFNSLHKDDEYTI